MRTIKAEDVKVGDTVVDAHMGPFTVRDIKVNHHFGWIGFDNGQPFGFFGWFKPDTPVAIFERSN